jgi:hypothetical protein
MPRIQPKAQDPRGQVVITRFECRSRYSLMVIYALHLRVKREVRRRVPGYLGGAIQIIWRKRTLVSISLWDELGSIYDMGQVQHHILASRVPHRMGAKTACGIYSYNGDWRQVMFGTESQRPEPLYPIQDSAEHTARSRNARRH